MIVSIGDVIIEMDEPYNPTLVTLDEIKAYAHGFLHAHDWTNLSKEELAEELASALQITFHRTRIMNGNQNNNN